MLRDVLKRMRYMKYVLESPQYIPENITICKFWGQIYRKLWEMRKWHTLHGQNVWIWSLEHYIMPKFWTSIMICFKTASTPFSKIIEHDCRDLLPFSHKRMPGSKSVLISKVFDGVAVRTQCRPVKFFSAKLGKPFLYRLAPWSKALSCLITPAFPQAVATKFEEHYCLKYCCMLRHQDFT